MIEKRVTPGSGAPYWETVGPKRRLDALDGAPLGEWAAVETKSGSTWTRTYAELKRLLPGDGTRAVQTLASAGGSPPQWTVASTQYLHEDFVRSTVLLTDETGAPVDVSSPPTATALVAYTAFAGRGRSLGALPANPRLQSPTGEHQGKNPAEDRKRGPTLIAVGT
jgi:hypothetical protein